MIVMLHLAAAKCVGHSQDAADNSASASRAIFEDRLPLSVSMTLWIEFSYLLSQLSGNRAKIGTAAVAVVVVRTIEMAAEASLDCCFAVGSRSLQPIDWN